MANLCIANTKNKIENKWETYSANLEKFGQNLEKFTKLSKPQILEILDIIFLITNSGKRELFWINSSNSWNHKNWKINLRIIF
jgi:hypothetical protein